MTIKMHPIVKKQWLEALRSGEYIQGWERLRGVKNNFCCLGVLCDLHSKLFQTEWENPTITGAGYEYYECNDIQPAEVSDWAWCEAGHIVPSVTIEGVCATLDTHNDKGRTFEEIANAIEEQL